MKSIGEAMRRQQLIPEQIADHREIFREMILSTCYVIENMLPLAEAHPELELVTRRAMELWWSVFAGENAVGTLRALFPNGYDYLLIVCRTLVSVRAYMGKPLIQWVAAHIHRRLASQQPRQVEPPDNESIRRALKNWIHVDLDKAPEALRLGMSDSNVVRIRPFITNPMQPEDDSFRLNIPNADSLVVKYGPVDEINQERENYARLPNSIRDCFVNIPQASYVDESRRRAFVIMADLHRYRTLSETLQKVPQIHEAIISELGAFLLRMHQGEGKQRRYVQEGLLLQLYLLPMQQHVRRIFSYMMEYKLLESEGKPEFANELQHSLLDQIANLVRRQLELEEFPIACMHGDLHSRNIMVRRLKRRENPEHDNEIDFKLIDLEKFRRSGDAAVDAGEILVDLELLRAARNAMTDRDPVVALMKSVETTYMRFAEEREDVTFPIRMELGQARALIRIAKGRTKQGEVALKESRRGPAIRVAFDVLGDAQQAFSHLEKVAKALK
jgi:Phosphotransferase enzyme family